MPVKIYDTDSANSPKQDRPSLVPVTRGNTLNIHENVSSLVRKGLTTLTDIERNGRIFASQAANCPRQAYLKSTQVGQEIVTPASQGYFTMGSAIEELVISALVRERALLFSQFKLPDVGLNLGGYIDGIVVIAGKVRVLEIKSCGELPNEPKPDHINQAMVYAAITGLPPTVFYFSRSVATFDGTLKIREFSITPTLEEIQAVLFRVAYAREAIDAGVIPDIPDEFTGKKDCGFCPFKEICWGEEPLPGPAVDTDTHLRLTKAARKTVKTLTDPEAVRNRRNGVLRHIYRFGTDVAKEHLSGDWDELLVKSKD